MRLKELFVMLALLSIIFLLGAVSVSANFSLGNQSHDIWDYYAKSSSLRGWINISFENQSLGSTFNDSLGNEILLKNIIDSAKNSNYQYNCDLENCENVYGSENSSVKKNYSLNESDSVLFGFELKGDISSINSVSFDVLSDASETCVSQIRGDLGEDGQIDFFNLGSSENTCNDEKIQGCFNPSNGTEYVEVTQTPLCQRMEFQEAPLFKVGAQVEEVENGTKNLTVNLYDLSGNWIVNCSLPKSTSGGLKEYTSCDMDLQVLNPTELYACISSTEGTGVYKIRKSNYSGSEKCGFEGIPPQTEDSSYDLFNQKLKFGKFNQSSNKIHVDNELYHGKNISEVITEYLSSKYGDLNCSDTCVFPVKIDSYTNQTIKLKNLKLNYTTSSGEVLETNFIDVYDIYPKINSGFQKLFLRNNFDLPEEQKDINYTLSLDGQEIFNKTLSIEDLSINISNTNVSWGVNSTFEITTTPQLEITNYFLDFGDGEVLNTSDDTFKKTYMDQGQFILDVEITTISGRIYQQDFLINVGSPREELQQQINDYINKLNNANNFLLSEDAFVKNYLENLLDLNGKDVLLDQLNQTLQIAETTEDFNSVISGLSGFDIPDSISKTTGQKNTITIPKSSIKLVQLKAITGEDINLSNSQVYVDNIYNWTKDNIEVLGNENTYYFNYGGNQSFKFNVFNVQINNPNLKEFYFFIDGLDGQSFKENLQYKSGFNYVKIENSSSKDVQFITTENLEVSSLPLFVSPNVTSLNLVLPNGKNNFNFKDAPWKWVLIALAILIVLSGAAYIILTKKGSINLKKKSSLNSNDLKGLLDYINASKRRNLDDLKIQESLEDAGWKTNQIQKAFREYYK